MVDQSPLLPQPAVAPTLNLTASVGNDIDNKGVTWKLSGTNCTNTGNGGTGSGQCGLLTNITPLTVTYISPGNLTTGLSVTLTATSIAQVSITKTATISVVLPVVFTVTGCNPTSPPNGVPCVLQGGSNGIPYNQTIAFTGGVSPYTVTSSPTPLPDCLKLVTSTTGLTATINQTPCNTGTTATTINFTATVTDSGGAPPVSQPYQITLAPAPPLSVTTTSLPAGTYGAPYNPSVLAQGGVPPLTYTFAPTAAGSLPAGDIAGLPPGLSANTMTGLISGVPTKQTGVTYPATYSFTVQVQDSSLPSPGQIQPPTPLPLTITIQAPTAVVISTSSLPAGMTATGYTGTLQATGGVGSYTWTLVQGQLPAGLTLQSNGTITGTPFVVTTTNFFTVQVADMEAVPMTATKQFNISVTAGINNNLLLKGSYSFLFNGFDSDGFVAIAGTLTADGAGHITAGSEDSNRISGVVTNATFTNPSSYSIDSNGDGRGTLELTASIGQQMLTVDYQLVLDSNGNVRFFENNATTTNTDTLGTHGEGVMKPIQGSSFSNASFSGHYSFVFRGEDLNGMPSAFGASITPSGNSLTITGLGDFNDAGTFDGGAASPQAFALSGVFSLIAGNRGSAQFTFAPSPSTPQVTMNFLFYFVSPSDLYFVEFDSSTTTGKPTINRLAGEMVLQNPSTKFNASVLQGSSVASGIAVNSSNSDVFAGLLTSTICDGVTAVNFSYDENSGGTITAPLFSGTCLVDPSGHVAFNALGATPAAAHIAAAYLTGPGQGFLLGSDAGVTTGLLEQQIGGPPYSNLTVMGTYVLSSPLIAESMVPNLLGELASNGGGSIAGTIDEIDPTGKIPNLGQAFSANFTSLATNGRGTMTTNATVPVGFPTSLIFYIVSPQTIRAISADASDQHPNLILLDH
jgi:Putative Ig domain